MQADKKQIVRLIKTARGQLDGILKMIEEDQYCVDIATQLMAADAHYPKGQPGGFERTYKRVCSRTPWKMAREIRRSMK